MRLLTVENKLGAGWLLGCLILLYRRLLLLRCAVGVRCVIPFCWAGSIVPRRILLIFNEIIFTFILFTEYFMHLCYVECPYTATKLR